MRSKCDRPAERNVDAELVDNGGQLGDCRIANTDNKVGDRRHGDRPFNDASGGVGILGREVDARRDHRLLTVGGH